MERSTVKILLPVNLATQIVKHAVDRLLATARLVELAGRLMALNANQFVQEASLTVVTAVRDAILCAIHALVQMKKTA